MSGSRSPLLIDMLTTAIHQQWLFYHRCVDAHTMQAVLELYPRASHSGAMDVQEFQAFSAQLKEIPVILLWGDASPDMMRPMGIEDFLEVCIRRGGLRRTILGLPSGAVDKLASLLFSCMELDEQTAPIPGSIALAVAIQR